MGFIKNMLQAHADKKNDFLSEWYWRSKYNSLSNEMEILKEAMASDIYKKVVKEMTEPLEVKRLKRTIERLNGKCQFLLEERNKYCDEVSMLKKKGRSIKNGKDEE